MDQARVIENLLAQVDGLKAQLASSTGQEAPPSQEQGGAKDGEVLSGLDFKAGERNFTSSSTTSVQIMADFTSKERTYTNGIVAKNEWRQQEGALTKETINIPDVNSGYPKAVNPVSWDGTFPSKTEPLSRAGGKPDVSSRRMKFGVVIPSTNTIVEWDFWRMIMENKIEGIGFHMSGLLVNAPKLATDEDMLNFLTTFRSQLFGTIDALMTAEPEYIIMGMSLETFFGGWEGNLELKNEIKARSGLSVATGAEACKAALTKFGAKNISVITPYQDIGDKNVVKFFEEIGYNVVRIAGLKCGSATDIAHVPEEWCEDIIRNQLVQPGVDCIVQCGTNLSMVKLSDRLERELGIPIIPINVACLWFAMRENGFTDKLDNCSRLFREF